MDGVLRDLEEEESYAKLASADGEQTEDPVVDWLTREEYAALSPAERNQRALDRYWKAKKIFFYSTAIHFSGRASRTFKALGGGTIPFQQ